MKGQPIAEMDRCPECGAEWRYQSPEGSGRWYTHLIGIYDRGQDRTVAWQCPGCKKQWPRGAIGPDCPTPGLGGEKGESDE